MTIQTPWIAKKGEQGQLSTLRHLMDCAAVSLELLGIAGLSKEPGVNATLALCCGLHDLGKLSSSFRAAIHDGASQPVTHWQLTPVILGVHDAVLGRWLLGSPERRRQVAEVVGGHHGEPVRPLDKRERLLNAKLFNEADRAEALRIVETMAEVMTPSAIDLDVFSTEEMAVLTWKLAGLTSQADWIASAEEWFPLEPDLADPFEEWRRSRARARRALESAGLGQAVPRENPDILEGREPTPMQREALHCPLPDDRCMVLIEDSTGAGKTEASFILASRMLRRGMARGIFFALPTMATSNAILARAEKIVPLIFDGDPTLALTHGRARHDKGFRKVRRSRAKGDGSASCTDWLASNGRKVLFADVGVGTIDQALMSVFPTRYSAIRLHALSDKVLVIDEAHSYDAYMEAALCRLLTYHARLGGSAVVMSATLPAKTRNALIAAWQQGMGEVVEIDDDPVPFPAMTAVGVTSWPKKVKAAPWTIRRVPVRRVPTVDDAVGRIAEASRRGAASIWIRNSVADAVEARTMLAAEGIEADLLHSRFALCDRLDREDRMMARFGKNGKGRRGGVIVATQVAEQSLDLDFDVMVSDLCPIGALIQRLGRLWRHTRPARPEIEPVLDILSPWPDERSGPDWLAGFMETGRFVYDADIMWRTAKAVFEAREVEMPGGLRHLIEAVHGKNPAALPGALERAAFAAAAEAAQHRAMARASLISPMGDYSYRTLAAIHDEERLGTRLGRPQQMLVLARRTAEGLVPWAPGRGHSAWAMSEVQVEERHWEGSGGVSQDSAEIRSVKEEWHKWQRENFMLVPVAEDGSINRGLRYDTTLGLQRIAR